MSFSHYRRFFPITDTDIYLNHAAVSPMSTLITDTISDYMNDRTRGNINNFKHLLGQRNKLKSNIATLINAAPENIALVANTSEGLNWLANGLCWQPGDHILLFENEFPANIYPFLNLERFGVKIDFVPSRAGKFYLEDIETRIHDQTRILSVSFVQFLTGYCNDLTGIGKICKENNVIFAVDGIQGIGALPLDVKAAQIDFLSNGGHKWLMAPQGCGFIYVNPTLEDNLIPVFAGWLSVKDSWNFLDYKLEFLEDAGRFEIGTPNSMGIIGACAATDLLLEVNPTHIRDHLLKLGDLLISLMSELDLNYLGSEQSKERSGIYSFTGRDIEGLFNYLSNEHIHISLRNNALRVSPHFYNNETEIKEFAHICKKYLAKK